MSYNCQLVERPAQPSLVIRTHTPVQNLSQVMGQAFGAIAQYLGQKGEQPAGPPFAAYHNMDMQNLDVEVGFPVAHALPGQGDIHASQIPGGQQVICLHVGPYDKIGAAFEALTQWLQSHHREASGIAYEVYLTDPTDTPPEALQTQVMFPLK